jgi:hypothetical protein
MRGIGDRVGREQAICEEKATVVPSGEFSKPQVAFSQRLIPAGNPDLEHFRQKMPVEK